VQTHWCRVRRAETYATVPDFLAAAWPSSTSAWEQGVRTVDQRPREVFVLPIAHLDERLDVDEGLQLADTFRLPVRPPRLERSAPSRRSVSSGRLVNMSPASPVASVSRSHRLTVGLGRCQTPMRV